MKLVDWWQLGGRAWASWTAVCSARAMAREFTDLYAWQRAHQLKRWVYAVTARPTVARDARFVAQFTDAAASGPRNVAEGFGRFHRREFAHFLKIAIGSEQEVRNHIIDACDRGHITATERDEGILLSRQAVTAALRLRRYLLSDQNLYS